MTIKSPWTVFWIGAVFVLTVFVLTISLSFEMMFGGTVFVPKGIRDHNLIVAKDIQSFELMPQSQYDRLREDNVEILYYNTPVVYTAAQVYLFNRDKGNAKINEMTCYLTVEVPGDVEQQLRVAGRVGGGIHFMRYDAASRRNIIMAYLKKTLNEFTSVHNEDLSRLDNSGVPSQQRDFENLAWKHMEQKLKDDGFNLQKVEFATGRHYFG